MLTEVDPSYNAAPTVAASGTDWRALLLGCVTYAQTGNPGSPDIWQLRRVNIHEVVFSLQNGGGAISAFPIEDARQGHQKLCEIDNNSRPMGNDAAGLALRKVGHDVLDDVLRFDDADQTGPPDVWRGCAWDGQEFRLKSMTQTTYASFWVTATAHDPACDYLGA